MSSGKQVASGSGEYIIVICGGEVASIGSMLQEPFVADPIISRSFLVEPIETSPFVRESIIPGLSVVEKILPGQFVVKTIVSGAFVAEPIMSGPENIEVGQILLFIALVSISTSSIFGEQILKVIPLSGG